MTDNNKLFTLNNAAARGSISEVEIALGRFKGHEAFSAASQAAKTALKNNKWENLAFLADFIVDMTHHPADDLSYFIINK